jgi:hypothetical protein
MVVVGDSFEGGCELIGGGVIGDFMDEIFEVDVGGFLKFSVRIGVNPDERGLLIIHDECIGYQNGGSLLSFEELFPKIGAWL